MWFLAFVGILVAGCSADLYDFPETDASVDSGGFDDGGDSGGDIDTDSDSDTDGDSDSETGSESDSESDSESEDDSDSESESDTESASDSEVDTDTETEFDTDTSEDYYYLELTWDEAEISFPMQIEQTLEGEWYIGSWTENAGLARIEFVLPEQPYPNGIRIWFYGMMIPIDSSISCDSFHAEVGHVPIAWNDPHLYTLVIPEEYDTEGWIPWTWSYISNNSYGNSFYIEISTVDQPCLPFGLGPPRLGKLVVTNDLEWAPEIY